MPISPLFCSSSATYYCQKVSPPQRGKCNVLCDDGCGRWKRPEGRRSSEVHCPQPPLTCCGLAIRPSVKPKREARFKMELSQEGEIRRNQSGLTGRSQSGPYQRLFIVTDTERRKEGKSELKEILPFCFFSSLLCASVTINNLW